MLTSCVMWKLGSGHPPQWNIPVERYTGIQSITVPLVSGMNNILDCLYLVQKLPVWIFTFPELRDTPGSGAAPAWPRDKMSCRQ